MKRKEIKVIWMISKQEFNRRFTLAVKEFYKSYTGDFNDTTLGHCIGK
jgi:hypothetical protein